MACLERLGANVAATDLGGLSALHLAAANASKGVVSLLVHVRPPDM